jgi:hypothetical protein
MKRFMLLPPGPVMSRQARFPKAVGAGKAKIEEDTMEKTLEFQVLVKYLEPRTLNAANIEGHTITQAKGFGVAVFKDGRFGSLDFIFAIDKQKDAGTAFGYGTYTFEDGSITERFTLGIDSNHARGEYKILSGTGAYAGATGGGAFDSIPNPYTSDRLYQVRLHVVTQVASQ